MYLDFVYNWDVSWPVLLSGGWNRIQKIMLLWKAGFAFQFCCSHIHGLGCYKMFGTLKIDGWKTSGSVWFFHSPFSSPVHPVDQCAIRKVSLCHIFRIYTGSCAVRQATQAPPRAQMDPPRRRFAPGACLRIWN